MPRGSEHYAPHVQALLRAARAGRILLSAPKPIDHEKDAGDDEEAPGEPYSGFVAPRWLQVAREAEQPEAEYLAKRRKGLPTLYGGASNLPTATLRKTRVKKVDNDGNPYFLDVLIPEGTFVEGEVAEGEIVPTQAPVPGTVVEGVGVANAEGIVVAGDQVAATPPRRKPPPPKRKPKGPGRGRKKKLIVENGAGGVPVAITANGGQNGTIDPITGQPNGTGDATGVNAEVNAAGDDSMLQDGEEGSDEDEEGEEGEDGDREEGELTETDDLLSRSVTPSKPPTFIKSKSPTKTAEDRLLAPPVPAPAENGTPSSTLPPPPSISIQPSEESSDANAEPVTLLAPEHVEPIPDLSSTSDIIPAPIEQDIPMTDVEPVEIPADAPTVVEPLQATMPADDTTSVDPFALAPPVIEPILASELDLSDPSSDATQIPGLDGTIEQTLPGTDLEAMTEAEAVPPASPIPEPIPLPTEPEIIQQLELEIQPVEPVSVEAPAAEPQAPVGAMIPGEHNPLEGLAAPKADQEQVDEQPPAEAAMIAADTLPLEESEPPQPPEAPEPAELPAELAEPAEPPPKEEGEEEAPTEVPEPPTANEDDIFGSLEQHLNSKSG